MDDNTRITIPLWVRVTAYVTGLLTAAFGTPTVVYLTATKHLDAAGATFASAILAGVGIVSGTLSLSHLSIPNAGKDGTN